MDQKDLLRSAAPRGRNLDRGLRLEYFSFAWNALEAVVGLAAGIAAGSVALVGFALDSVVESSSAAILLWRLRSERHGGQPPEDVERRAVRLVAIAFLGLALYVGIKSAYGLINGVRPDESIPGIILAAVSLVVMPFVAWRKQLLLDCSIVVRFRPTRRRHFCARICLRSSLPDCSRTPCSDGGGPIPRRASLLRRSQPGRGKSCGRPKTSVVARNLGPPATPQ